jgi:hypothetical protein
MFAIMKIFVTDISASTGRNGFIFDIWLLHGDLYRVSPSVIGVTRRLTERIHMVRIKSNS